MSNVLPPELWREIFAHACYTPYLLDTKWNYDPDDRLWQGWDPEVHDSSIDTKRAIVQVCREWHALGVEFLYETIQIPLYGQRRRFLKLDKPTATLHDSVLVPPATYRGEKLSSRGYGWWIKRIDCPCYFLGSTLFPNLMSLLEQCHNLSIFTIKPRSGGTQATMKTMSQLWNTFQSRFYHSLRHVDFKWSSSMDGVELPCILLSTLALAYKHPPPNIYSNPMRQTLTALTLFIPNDLQNDSDAAYFPNLRYLGFMNIANSDCPVLYNFMKRHRTTVRSFYVQTAVRWVGGLAPIIHLGTSLRSLTLNFFEPFEFRGPSKFIGISHLGIGSAEGDLKSQMDWIHTTLDEGKFPNLKLIRLLDQDGPIPYDATWADRIDRCEKAGLRLKDRQGRPLVCRGAL